MWRREGGEEGGGKGKGVCFVLRGVWEMGGGEGGLKARQGRRGMDVVAGPVVDALSASFAAMCAVTLTHPMDTVKTRIQTSQTKGFAALRNAVTQSGPGGLLAGVKPIILGSSMSSAIKFSTYHALTRAMLPLFPLQSVALLRASCASFASVLSSLICTQEPPWTIPSLHQLSATRGFFFLEIAEP